MQKLIVEQSIVNFLYSGVFRTFRHLFGIFEEHGVLYALFYVNVLWYMSFYGPYNIRDISLAGVMQKT